MGLFEGKKNRKKVAQCRIKLKQSHSAEKMLESFWLKQGLEPVTVGFTVNRVKTVLASTRERVKSVKSGTYTMRSVV